MLRIYKHAQPQKRPCAVTRDIHKKSSSANNTTVSFTTQFQLFKPFIVALFFMTYKKYHVAR